MQSSEPSKGLEGWDEPERVTESARQNQWEPERPKRARESRREPERAAHSTREPERERETQRAAGWMQVESEESAI